MNTNKKSPLSFLFICLSLILSFSCTDFDDDKENVIEVYRSLDKAPSLKEEKIRRLDHLGATVVDSGVNFSVYSEKATRIEVLLFDDPESERPTRQFELKRFGDVWNIFVEGIGYGQHYGYIAFGPNWDYDEEWFCGSTKGFKSDVDLTGNRFNPNKLLIDPYARAIHREHDWSKGSTASGPRRGDCTWDAASKSVIVKSEYKWSENEKTYWEKRKAGTLEGHGDNEIIIYEVHPKGFTKNDASGVAHPGTFRGIGEKAPYLKELGITAVELLPIHEKPLEGGYWGYWTLNFFAPEQEYMATKKVEERIDEFKWMVDQLHQNGIEVILDVVYNHTGEGGLWKSQIFGGGYNPDPYDQTNIEPKEVAGLYSFRGFDNAAYYALSEDNQAFWNNAGVGNQMRANHTPMRRLIMDSIRFYVEEMHVDGFRFDLAAVLGEVDGDHNRWDDPKNTILQELIDDPVFQERNIRFIAEPWAAGGSYGSCVGAYPISSSKEGFGWGEWNPHFRDWWRSIVNMDDWKLNSYEGPVDGGASLTGSSPLYSYNNRKPYHSVNFVTAHDGFTLYDLVSYNEKKNGPGPLNTICLNNKQDAWCDLDSGDDHNRSRDWGQGNESFKRQVMRNLFAAMFVAHGTPMMLGGDEWMRTQLGNNNPYSNGADNEWNWFRWGEWKPNQERNRMFDFVKNMIKLRKKYKDALAPKNYADIKFAWKNESNSGDPDWSGRAMMQHFYDEKLEKELLIIYNMNRDWTNFTLPEGRTWKKLVDTQEYFDKDDFIKGQADPKISGNINLENPEEVKDASYRAYSTSIVILEGERK